MDINCVHSKFNGILQDDNHPFFNKVKVHLTPGADFAVYLGGVQGKGVKFTLTNGAHFYSGGGTDMGTSIEVDNTTLDLRYSVKIKNIDSTDGSDLLIEGFYYMTKCFNTSYGTVIRFASNDVAQYRYNEDLIGGVFTCTQGTDITFLKKNKNLENAIFINGVAYEVMDFVTLFISGGRATGIANFGTYSANSVTFNGKTINVNSWGYYPVKWESASKVSVGPSTVGQGANQVYCMGYTDEEIAEKWPGKSVTKVD